MRASLFYSLILFLLLLCNACREDVIEANAIEDRKRSDETEATFIDTVAKEVTFLYEKKHCFYVRYSPNDTVLATLFGLYERRGDSVFVDCPDWNSNAYHRIKSKYLRVEYGSFLQFDGIKDYKPVMVYNQCFVAEPADIANDLFHLKLDHRTVLVYTGYVKDTMIITGNKITRL